MRTDNFQLPEWANWLAQDEDGSWWCYEQEPNQSHQGWYENEVGRSKRLATSQPNRFWANSLRPV